MQLRVVTTRTNDYMPLIRYRIGDWAERCERSNETAYVVHGRVIDTLLTPEGERVTTHQIDRCFDGVARIAHYQLRQAEDGRWRLRFVPEGTGPGAEELAELRTRLERWLGTGTCQSIEATDLLPGESSGKFRLTGPV